MRREESRLRAEVAVELPAYGGVTAAGEVTGEDGSEVAGELPDGIWPDVEDGRRFVEVLCRLVAVCC